MASSQLTFKIANYPTVEAVKAVRKGIPSSAFDGVAKTLYLTAEDLATTLGISIRTVRDQRKKQVPLSREISEKLVRTARIQELGRKLFITDKAVADWLSTPAPALDGQCPISLLDTEIGAREVEGVLQGMAFGNVL